MQFYGNTTYTDAFSPKKAKGDKDDKDRDRRQQKEHRDRMRKGTMNPTTNLPFRGVSTAADTFRKHAGRDIPDKCYPRNEVSFALLIISYALANNHIKV